MASRVIRRPQFEDDLIDVWLYIAADNEPAADRFLDRLERAISMLADRPLAGRARPELGSGLRSFSVGNYVIFYKTDAQTTELYRVLSGYLDLPQEALE